MPDPTPEPPTEEELDALLRFAELTKDDVGSGRGLITVPQLRRLIDEVRRLRPMLKAAEDQDAKRAAELGRLRDVEEQYEELISACLANLEACTGGDFCNDVTRVWDRLLAHRAALEGRSDGGAT